MAPTTHSGGTRPMLLGPRQGRVAQLLWSSLGVPVFRTSAPPLAAYAQWRNLSACRSHSTADHRWPVRSVPRDCLPRLRANARRIGRTFAPLAALWGVRQPGVAMCRLVLGWRGARGHHVAAAAAARRLGASAPGKTKAIGQWAKIGRNRRPGKGIARQLVTVERVPLALISAISSAIKRY